MSAPAPTRISRRGRRDFDCNNLLEQQQRRHRQEMRDNDRLWRYTIDAMEESNRRGHGLVRFIAAASLAILAGLVGVKLTGFEFSGFLALF